MNMYFNILYNYNTIVAISALADRGAFKQINRIRLLGGYSVSINHR